jgi:probable HAF family extracellular repeat protein
VFGTLGPVNALLLGMIKHMRIRPCFLMALCLGWGHGLSAEILYSVTHVGTLAGTTSSYASAINNAGQVVGFSGFPNFLSHAFLYSNGQMQDLGTLPGGRNSYAYAINNAGQVTGAANPSVGPPVAFLYSNGQMQMLGSLGPPCCSTGKAINDRGQITGSANTPFDLHAFLYSDGQMRDLGALLAANYSVGTGINNAGQVTGWYQISGGPFHSFLYSSGTMTDIGTLPGYVGSQAVGINDAGQVIGTAYASSGINHIFVYADGQIADLGDGMASAINNHGQVVGLSKDDVFLYSKGQMTDLNGSIDPALGVTLSGVTGINDSGQIVANGVFSSDRSTSHAFLLTPICAAPVISDVSARPNVLWPPNHRFVQVAIGYTVDDACPRTCGLSVSSNEPVKGEGDGNKSADWRVVDANHVDVRAERDGNGTGRVYTVSVNCVNDKNQQTSTRAVEISVPHDESH